MVYDIWIRKEISTPAYMRMCNDPEKPYLMYFKGVVILTICTDAITHFSLKIQVIIA
jgi:hypothetical protein